MKKLLLALVTLCFSVSLFAVSEKLYDESKTVKDTGSVEFNAKSAYVTVKNMGLGWNLGNTLDATGGNGLNSETSWGQPKTNKYFLEELAVSGIKTIRIPVSWARHIDKKTYTIDSAWMKRVKEIVDWCIANDMYVIINSHHDNWNSPKAMPAGSGYYPNSTNFEESERYLTNIWAQICTTFNNGYDEHLIFETMNEPRLVGTSHEWWFDRNAQECKDAAATLNKLNQVVVDTVRASGGNNQKRFIMCPGLQASPDSALASDFFMPVDDEPGKLILSVHAYSPYNFAMAAPGDKEFTSGHKAELDNMFQRLSSKFTISGIPVVVGEYGATNKGNTAARVEWFKYFIKTATKYGMACCVWDNGQGTASASQGEHFGYFNRTNWTWFEPKILEAMKEGLNSK